MYVSEYWRLPHWNHIDLYLLNAWLIIRFLYQTNMCTNPEKLLLNQVETRISKYEAYIDCERKIKD